MRLGLNSYYYISEDLSSTLLRIEVGPLLETMLELKQLKWYWSECSELCLAGKGLHKIHRHYFFRELELPVPVKEVAQKEFLQ